MFGFKSENHNNFMSGWSDSFVQKLPGDLPTENKVVYVDLVITT